MLEGWDSQSWFWQANKAAMAEHFGVTTKDLRREWDAAEQAVPEEQGSREFSRDLTNNTTRTKRLLFGR